MADAYYVDEGTPLLRSRQKPNPLPKLQIGIILFLQIAEPIASMSIYPYINQLVSELDITGGDERKVGYYAGLVESLFFAAESLTVLHWSRISDVVGRKPVLLIGSTGTALSMLLFGLSRTFWTLVLSRCLCGVLNGNIGVMKSVMGELTDSTNRAEGFSLIPVTWAIGVTIGPMIGGTLSRPHERFPNVFTPSFWKDYPYFLPCAVSAGIVIISLIVTALFFKETAPRRVQEKIQSSDSSSECSSLSDTKSCAASNKPLPLRELLVYPVVISVSNYASLAFLDIALNALLPLFFAMPIQIGGLGLSPATIGYLLGSYGAVAGVYQIFFFAKVVRRFGERRIFILGMMSFIPLFMLFPVTSFVARKFGVGVPVYALVGLQLGLMLFMDMAYGSISIFITASAPNKHSLGATNGLSQTTVSITRAIGPALSTSMFSFSVQRNIMGGYCVYAIFVVISVLSLFLAVRLPHKMWEQSTDDDDTEE